MTTTLQPTETWKAVVLRAVDTLTADERRMAEMLLSMGYHPLAVGDSVIATAAGEHGLVITDEENAILIAEYEADRAAGRRERFITPGLEPFSADVAEDDEDYSE